MSGTLLFLLHWQWHVICRRDRVAIIIAAVPRGWHDLVVSHKCYVVHVCSEVMMLHEYVAINLTKFTMLRLSLVELMKILVLSKRRKPTKWG